VTTGEIPIQRSITSEGILTGDPHNHDYFEDFSDSVAEDFEITSGEFIIVQGGNGSGTVLTIRQNGGNPNVIVAFGESPAAGLPLKFSVEGNTLPGYNTTQSCSQSIDTVEISGLRSSFDKPVS